MPVRKVTKSGAVTGNLPTFTDEENIVTTAKKTTAKAAPSTVKSTRTARTVKAATVEAATKPAPSMSLDVNTLATVNAAPTVKKSGQVAKAAPAKKTTAKAAPAKKVPVAKAAPAKKVPVAKAAPSTAPVGRPRQEKIYIPGVGYYAPARLHEDGTLTFPIGEIAADYAVTNWTGAKARKVAAPLKAVATIVKAAPSASRGNAKGVYTLNMHLAEATLLAQSLFDAAPMETGMLRSRLRQHARAVAGRCGFRLIGDTLD